MSEAADDLRQQPEYQRCQQVLQEYERELMGLPDVLGVGVGRGEQGQLGLVLLMTRPPEDLEEAVERLLPLELKGIPVWPRSIGSVRPLSEEAGEDQG
jgi:hypothetical protein